MLHSPLANLFGSVWFTSTCYVFKIDFSRITVLNYTSVRWKEVLFASFLSGGFMSALLVNPTKRKQANRTSVYCSKIANQTLWNNDTFIRNFWVFYCQDVGFSLWSSIFVSSLEEGKRSHTHSIIIKVFKLASVQPLGALSHSAPHARGALFSLP